MLWDYVVGSVGGAGAVLGLGALVVKRFVEQAVDIKFAEKLEEFRAEKNRKLEFDKSDLSVWADLRKDILTEMWSGHRDIVKQMTAVILDVQALQGEENRSRLKSAIDEFRKAVHGQIDLLSPQAIEICQEFLEKAYRISTGDEKPDDANPLKAIRGEFYAHTARLYGLEGMMPWMAGKQRENP
jgi:hypothetical protein